MGTVDPEVKPTAPSRRRAAREFVVDTIVVAATQVLLKLRALVTLPLIVRLLGTAAYGIWSQTISFVSLSAALLGGNLHLPLVRFIAADGSRAREVYSSLLVASIASSALGGIPMILLAAPLSDALMGGSGLEAYLRLGVALIVVGGVRTINLNLYRATGRLLARSAVELVTTGIELVGIFVLLSAGTSLLDVLRFMAAWEGLVALGTTVHCLRIAGWAAPRPRIWSESFRYTLPLLPASLAVWMLDRVDRFVVGHYRGADGVGIYSANYALASLLLLFQAPFQMTLLPRVASLWDTDRAQARRYIELSSKAFLTLAIPFTLGIPMIAPFVLARLGNAQIADSSEITTFLVAAGVILWGTASMQFQVFHGAKSTGAVGTVTLGAAALNLGLNFAMVPWMGVVGAALATTIAYGVVFVATAGLSRRHLPLEYQLVYLAKCTVCAIGMAAFLRLAHPNTLAALFASVVAGVVLYFSLLLVLRAFSQDELAFARRVLRRLVPRKG